MMKVKERGACGMLGRQRKLGGAPSGGGKGGKGGGVGGGMGGWVAQHGSWQGGGSARSTSHLLLGRHQVSQAAGGKPGPQEGAAQLRLARHLERGPCVFPEGC